jgi:chaperonin GroES
MEGNMTKMKPMGDRILIKERKKEETTKSGIIIPDSIEGNYIYGDVISVGPGLFSANGVAIPMTVKIGDVVCMYKSNQGTIKLDEEEYILVRESEILMNSGG